MRCLPPAWLCWWAVAVVATGVLASGWPALIGAATVDLEGAAIRRIARTPLGLPALDLDLQPTREMIALGRKLFLDRRLSVNGTMSCATCHIPEHGFTNNELATPLGVEGRSLRRNAPTLLNVAYQASLFHDGRDVSLETQALMPLIDSSEMANPSLGLLIERIHRQPHYRAGFDAAFGEGANATNLGRALAAYQRTLLSANAPFDHWRYGNDHDVMSAEAIRGFELFSGKAGCASCHLVGERYALFTDHDFHNTGIGELRRRETTSDAPVSIELAPGLVVALAREAIRAVGEADLADDGRLEVTGRPEDLHHYRTPTLRNVALTAPYMHDGSLATLDQVVRYYDQGGSGHAGIDPRLRPLYLSEGEIGDLIAFLHSLTGDNVDELIGEARRGSH